MDKKGLYYYLVMAQSNVCDKGHREETIAEYGHVYFMCYVVARRGTRFDVGFVLFAIAIRRRETNGECDASGDEIPEDRATCDEKEPEEHVRTRR